MDMVMLTRDSTNDAGWWRAVLRKMRTEAGHTAVDLLGLEGPCGPNAERWGADPAIIALSATEKGKAWASYVKDVANAKEKIKSN